ncbi:MAG: 16S rRNA (cytosine(1402)-N(4))-methyltransferase RsmH, partial [Rhodothermales bacterium]
MTSEGDEIGHEADEDDGILRHASAYHAPVLWHTVVRDLITDREGVYVDGTLGGGGHTAALLAALSRAGRVIGIDRDAAAIKEAGQRLSDEEAAGRLTLVHGRFGDVSAHLDTLGIKQVDGLLLDLGISSHQVDLPERGFSYMAEGALDMRMNQAAGPSASDVINEWPERDLAQLFFEFGEEPGSRRIARAIVAARPLSTTRELADVVRSVVPGREEVKTLSRVFQALRIVVNQELAELEQALEGAAEEFAGAYGG